MIALGQFEEHLPGGIGRQVFRQVTELSQELTAVGRLGLRALDDRPHVAVFLSRATQGLEVGRAFGQRAPRLSAGRQRNAAEEALAAAVSWQRVQGELEAKRAAWRGI